MHPSIYKLTKLLLGLFILLGTIYPQSNILAQTTGSLASETPSNQSLTDAPLASNRLLSTPQNSIHTFIHWQQTGHRFPDRFIQPFKLAQGSDEDKVELAKQLLKVLDARGLLVVYDQIPDITNYIDSLSGLSQYILFDSLPEIYLSQVNGEWVFSEQSIQQIPSLYRATFSSTLEAFIDALPPVAEREWFGLKLWQIIGLFVWLIIALSIRKIFESLLLQYLAKWAKKTRVEWDDLIITSVQKPLGLVIMIGF